MFSLKCAHVGGQHPPTAWCPPTGNSGSVTEYKNSIHHSKMHRSTVYRSNIIIIEEINLKWRKLLFQDIIHSGGSRISHWGVADLRHGCFLAKMYVKMKELDPVGGGGCMLVAPPGSTNNTFNSNFHILKIHIGGFRGAPTLTGVVCWETSICRSG